ncbi:MAG: lamin tail domain-containing protein [Crocinitomicaceae bacterium]
MRSKLIGILFLLTTTSFSNAQLIISEYLEGPSNDKCIEIYNTTGAAINLTGYNLKLYFNGSTTVGGTINLSGSIPSCGTYVICNTSASQAGSANLTSGGLTYNGDDAVGLYNGSTLLDLFGNIGNDPGTEWTGVGNGTANDGFVRNTSYCTGVTVDPIGTGPASFTTFTAGNWTSVGMTGATLGSHTSTCGSCGVSNTITITSVSSLTYNVDCITGATGNVDFSSTGTFTAGNTYTVQLSDASGSFAAPIAIGSLVSTSNGPSNINFTIPPGTATGTGYRIRIISSSPSVTSAPNGSNIGITLTTNCIPPHMTSVIINSCNAICNEGVNEMVFGTSGDYSIDVTAANFNFSYTNTPPITSGDNFTDILTNNSTTTGVLNDQCASTDPFIDANGTTIPPNSSWVLLNNNICVADALDWTGLCNSGPIYVIYSSDPTWLSGGNFSNTTNGIRPYQTSITTTSGQTFTIDYETDGSQYADSDGVFATFDENGGSATSYGDDNCLLQPIVLPIELYSFDGEIQNQASLLNWTTITEYNFSHFNIYHATDITSFYKIGSVAAAGNTELKQDYRMTHPNPVPGVNYYRLSAIDNNGSERNHGILALRMNIHFAYYNGSAIVLESPYAIEICNLQGQLITQSNDELEIPFNQSGVFLIREIESGTIQKIVIQ